MLSRDQFNSLQGFYLLTHIGKANCVENNNQYLLSVYFSLLNSNELESIKSNLCLKDKLLNLDVLKKRNTNIDKNIQVLLSPKELPHLICGSIWNQGQCVLAPKDYLPKISTAVSYNWPKDAKEKTTIYSKYENYFDPTFQSQNVYIINPTKNNENKINFILPVYEALRAFYFENSKVADSCFQGKSIVNIGMSFEGREILNIPDSCGYVVLEKHIKDSQAWLGYRLLSNARYLLEFTKVHVSLKNKENNGPLIDFPIDWYTDLSFHGYFLNKDYFYICQITDFTDFSYKINEFKYGRVNDSRKGKNFNSDELIKQNGGTRINLVAEVGDFNPISDIPKSPNVLEIDLQSNNCVVNRPIGLFLNKIEKDFQVYQNEANETFVSTDGISIASTSNDYFDGSLAGGVYLNSLGKIEDKNFDNRIELLIKNLKKLKKIQFESFKKPVESSVSIDSLETYKWAHLKKVKKDFYTHPRNIAFIQFQYKNHDCFLIEIQPKSTELKKYTLGIAVGKIDNDNFSINNLVDKIKLVKGIFSHLEDQHFLGLKFSYRKHQSNPKQFLDLIFETIEELIL